MSKAIQGIIWDLDGTLYRYVPDYLERFIEGAGQAALDLGVALSLEDSCRMARESFHQYGHVCRTFADQYDLDMGVLVHNLLLNVKEEQVCIKIDGLPEAFEQTNVSHAILTHGSRAWAHRMLKHLGIEKHFSDDRILALDDSGMLQKNLSPLPYLRAIAAMQLEASALAVLEDSSSNMVPAHDLGLTTVYIHYGQPLFPLPPHIHQQLDNPIEFLRSLG